MSSPCYDSFNLSRSGCAWSYIQLILFGLLAVAQIYYFSVYLRGYFKHDYDNDRRQIYASQQLVTDLSSGSNDDVTSFNETNRSSSDSADNNLNHNNLNQPRTNSDDDVAASIKATVTKKTLYDNSETSDSGSFNNKYTIRNNYVGGNTAIWAEYARSAFLLQPNTTIDVDDGSEIDLSSNHSADQDHGRRNSRQIILSRAPTAVLEYAKQGAKNAVLQTYERAKQIYQFSNNFLPGGGYFWIGKTVSVALVAALQVWTCFFVNDGYARSSAAQTIALSILVGLQNYKNQNFILFN